jgi:hypothetical protein
MPIRWLASVHSAFIIKKKHGLGVAAWLLLPTENVFGLLAYDVFFVQDALVRNSANVLAESVCVTYFRSGPVLDFEIQLRQFDSISLVGCYFLRSYAGMLGRHDPFEPENVSHIDSSENTLLPTLPQTLQTFIWRIAYAIGRSTPSCTWDKMAATATLEVSVVQITGNPKSGYASTGVVHSLFFKSSEACYWLRLQTPGPS